MQIIHKTAFSSSFMHFEVQFATRQKVVQFYKCQLAFSPALWGITQLMKVFKNYPDRSHCRPDALCGDLLTRIIFVFGVVLMPDAQNSELTFPRLEKIYCAGNCWIFFFLPTPWIVILHKLLHLIKDWISELSNSKISLDCSFHRILPPVLTVTSVHWLELLLQWFLRQRANLGTKINFVAQK